MQLQRSSETHQRLIRDPITRSDGSSAVNYSVWESGNHLHAMLRRLERNLPNPRRREGEAQLGFIRGGVLTEHRDKVLGDRRRVVWVCDDHSREGSSSLCLRLGRACLNERHRSSEVIRGHQRSSEVISGHQWSSEVIRGHQRSSVVISGHQRSSEVIRGHQWSSQVLRGTQRPSEAIRGHQRSSEGHQKATEVL